MTAAATLLELARAHVGERYVLGAIVPKANPAWQGPWDCAEFASWCVYQTTNALFGCRPSAGNPDVVDAYTGFWAQDAKKIGEEISIGLATATPGAFLLRVPDDGTIGHVVISAGGGNTIEAQIRATKELGWKFLEMRGVEGTGFAKANFHDIPEKGFAACVEKLRAVGKETGTVRRPYIVTVIPHVVLRPSAPGLLFND